MAISYFLSKWADIRRWHHTKESLRLHKSLHSASIIFPLTTTRHPQTPLSLSSASNALVLRAAIYSLAHQNDPNNPPKMKPASIENPRFGEEGSGVMGFLRRFWNRGVLKKVLALTCDSANGGTCHVYVVGTSHVSQESCKEVEAVIRYIKPQVVFLELCESRKDALTCQDLKVPTMSELIIDRLKNKQHPFDIVFGWAQAKIGDQLGVVPGSEFRVGYEEANKCGSEVVLGDRPIDVTVQRTWRKMPLWHKTILLCSLILAPFLFQRPSADTGINLDRLSSADVDELIQEIRKIFPTLYETLIDERDQYMSSTLLSVARRHHSVVAVVGIGHLPGIKKYWLQPVDMDKLMEIS